MAINHGINAQDNNLNEILQTKQNAGKMITEATAIERQVAAIENNPNAAMQKGGLLGRAEKTGLSLGSGSGSNRAGVYSDMALNKLTGGIASAELASMGLKIFGEGMGIFKSVKGGFAGKKNGYQAGDKSSDRSIHTGTMSRKDKRNLLAFRAAAVCGFNSESGTSGVTAAKGSAPNLKAEKAMVYAKKMEHAQTYGVALQAEAAKHTQIHQAMQMGGAQAPALVASLKQGPKAPDFKKPMEQKSGSIWDSESGTATT